MSKYSRFKHVAPRIVQCADVIVEVPGPFCLVYKKKGQSISFRMDHELAAELFFTYLIYVPLNPVWEETGVKLTDVEMKALTRDVIDALELFGALALFIAPKNENVASVGDNHVN